MEYETTLEIVARIDAQLSTRDDQPGGIPTVLYYDQGELLEHLDQVIRALLSGTLEVEGEVGREAED